MTKASPPLTAAPSSLSSDLVKGRRKKDWSTTRPTMPTSRPRPIGKTNGARGRGTPDGTSAIKPGWVEMIQKVSRNVASARRGPISPLRHPIRMPNPMTRAMPRSTRFMGRSHCRPCRRGTQHPNPRPSPTRGRETSLASGKLGWPGSRGRNGGDPPLPPGCIAGDDGHQPLALFGHRASLGPGQPAQGLDRQRRGVAGALDRPGALYEAVDQKSAPENRVSVGMIDHTSPVIVTDQDVVVFREEARWRRRLRVGEGTIRDIEQLAAPLVLKRPQFRAKPFDDAAKSGQPRPRRDVRDGGGTGGLEIAQDQPIR